MTETLLDKLTRWSEYAHRKFNGQRLDEFSFELSLSEVDEIKAALEAARKQKSVLDLVVKLRQQGDL